MLGWPMQLIEVGSAEVMAACADPDLGRVTLLENPSFYTGMKA